MKPTITVNDGEIYVGAAVPAHDLSEEAMTTPTPSLTEQTILQLQRDLAAAQEEAKREKMAREYWEGSYKRDLAAAQEARDLAVDKAMGAAAAMEMLERTLKEAQEARKHAEADAENYRKDAERWKEIKAQFSPMGLNIDGNHAWQWRGSPSRLKGPNMDAAIDAAIAGEKP